MPDTSLRDQYKEERVEASIIPCTRADIEEEIEIITILVRHLWTRRRSHEFPLSAVCLIAYR